MRLLAGGVLLPLLPADWSWRSFFILGGLPALLAIFVRYKVKESDAWRRTRTETWAGLGQAITQHWRLFIYLTVLMMMMNFASHGTQDLYPNFLEQERHFTGRKSATLRSFTILAPCSVASASGCYRIVLAGGEAWCWRFSWRSG